MNYITREFIQAHPDVLFVFGDNDVRSGLGGMAREFRNEPNSIGIRTKKYPGMNEGDFYVDADLDKNKRKIDEDVQNIVKRVRNFRNIYVPVGIGEGYARLQESAPETYRYLKAQLSLLRDATENFEPS